MLTIYPMSNYQDKKQERIERYEGYAESAKTRAESAHERAHRIGSGIPFGQPILVGHHSEKHHRRDIEKIDYSMRKSIDEGKKAEHWADRAHGVATSSAISGQDPEALIKLREKLVKLEEQRDEMKKVNKAFKKGTLADLGWSSEQIAQAEATSENAYSWEKERVHPKWQITNLGANIRTVKKRIVELTLLAAKDNAPLTGKDCKVEFNPDPQRIEIFFDGPPVLEIRSQLKHYGFRWTPSILAWTATDAEHRRAFVRHFLEAE